MDNGIKHPIEPSSKPQMKALEPKNSLQRVYHRLSGSPMVKISRFRCRGHGSVLIETKIPHAHAAEKQTSKQMPQDSHSPKKRQTGKQVLTIFVKA